MKTYMILVPRAETTLAPGSGIVAEATEETVKVYYEGNLYGAVNLHEIDDRVLCAAGRLHDQCPTCAWHRIQRDQLEDEYLIVGVYLYESNEVKIDPDMLTAWHAWANQYRPKY